MFYKLLYIVQYYITIIITYIVIKEYHNINVSLNTTPARDGNSNVELPAGP